MPKKSESETPRERLLSVVAEAVERIARQCGEREKYEADMRQTAEALKTAAEAYAVLCSISAGSK